MGAPPVIIHFNGFVPYKPLLWCPYLWKPSDILKTKQKDKQKIDVHRKLAALWAGFCSSFYHPSLFFVRPVTTSPAPWSCRLSPSSASPTSRARRSPETGPGTYGELRSTAKLRGHGTWEIHGKSMGNRWVIVLPFTENCVFYVFFFVGLGKSKGRVRDRG